MHDRGADGSRAAGPGPALIESWGGGGATPDLIVDAQGAYLRDRSGRSYLDFVSQASYASIGHGDARIMRAITAAHPFATVRGGATAPTRRLADKLLSLLPASYQRVFFGLNGADAIEAALKVARVVTGRQNVISFSRQYHGASMGAASVTGNAWPLPLAGQPVPGTILLPPPYRYRSAFNAATQQEADDLTVALLRDTIEQVGPATIAAVIGEPVPTGRGGAILPGRTFWQQVRAVCDRYGILLVSDEVVTGFGRLGHWFALEHYGYEPDILCLGKGITSGYLPLSAAVLRQPLADQLAGRRFPHGMTYSGHALCCAAALANIAVIEEDDLVGNAARMGELLAKRLDDLKAAHPSIGETVSLGLFSVIELVKDRATKAPFAAGDRIDTAAGGHAGMGAQVMHAMEELGVRILGADGILKLTPPLIVTADQIDRAIDGLDHTLGLVDRLVDSPAVERIGG